MIDLVIALTARCGSERFPNKVLQLIDGKPVIAWIAERLAKTKESVVVLATTKNKEDDALESTANAIDIPCYRHADPDDVVGRLSAVADMYPEARFVVRGLGDCPFMEPAILNEVVNTLDRYRGDAFSWMLPPETMPVYGAREFPYSMSGWQRIDRNAQGWEREHADAWYNYHRDKFKIVYHEPPTSDYFRLYRLELDWPEDLELMRQVAKGVGMLAPLPEINRWLDNNPDVAAINRMRQEKTGPTVNYNYEQRREWYRLMEGRTMVDWTGRSWNPPNEKAVPIFCSNGHCLIGYGHDAQLFLKDGSCIRGYSKITCPCGAGKVWKNPIRSGR